MRQMVVIAQPHAQDLNGSYAQNRMKELSAARHGTAQHSTAQHSTARRTGVTPLAMRAPARRTFTNDGLDQSVFWNRGAFLAPVGAACACCSLPPHGASPSCAVTCAHTALPWGLQPNWKAGPEQVRFFACRNHIRASGDS